MENKTKKFNIWLLIGILLLAGAICLGVFYYLHSDLRKPPQSSPVNGAAEGNMPVPSFEAAEVNIPVPEESPAEEMSSGEEEAASREIVEQEENPEEYVSPVDFEAAWAVNEDVIAWLYIPGIKMSYPIMMDPSDNTYYLTHDAERNSSSAGAVFIEDYNKPDFQDMCTVIYGHRMYDGDMFGILQSSYSDAENLEKNRYIGVFLPDREIWYEVFAAVPFDNSHILYYNDFDDQHSYRMFINSIYATEGLDATLDSEREPAYGEKLLILSTCLWGDKNSRFLVLAKELSE